ACAHRRALFRHVFIEAGLVATATAKGLAASGFARLAARLAIAMPGIGACNITAATVVTLLVGGPAGPLAGIARTLGTRIRLHRRLPSHLVVDRSIEVRVGVFDETGAELVAQGAATHLDDLAFRQVAELERPVGNTDQAVNLEAERAKDVLNFAV